jgi:hypothetical protein
MRVIRWWASAAALLVLMGCTPAYTEKSGKELAGRAGITDAVTIERSNQRLLSRQGQVCLLSDLADAELGQALLRSMQTAFTGYFLTVGAESSRMDLSQALAGRVCSGAAYLFFVQAVEQPCLTKPEGCGNYARADFVITLINSGDGSLLDRVKFSVRNSWLPLPKQLQTDNAIRLQNAFEQLAVALTGADPI